MSEDQTFYAYQMVLEKPLREMPPWPTRRGRPRGGPFRDRAHCLERLREWAELCRKNDWSVTKEQMGLLAMDKRLIRTEDPESAARTITRWCKKYYHIDFEREVKGYHRTS